MDSLRRNGIAVWCMAVLLLTACQSRSAPDARSGMDADGANWAAVGRGHDEQGFSPLKSINDSTISKLGLAWSLDLPDETTLEGVPLAIDGTLYFAGSMAKIYAVDAASGRLLWEYDPKAYEARPKAFRLLFPVNR